ncbi:oligosaccharide flippase family protein [Citricoccus sp. NPDC079358]|uniref:oligosaccharide flippase family protein n=1 Tax=Citricoccus sp. NPDC079358 TaxID=3154653 RepID=UPI00344EB5AE
MSSLSSLVLVAWLSPEEFGLWASAVSACAVLVSLKNFGASQAYLAGVTGSLRRTRKRAALHNLCLALIALVIAGVYFSFGRADIALLVALVGLTIPLQGDADLLYSETVRQRKNATAVRAQGIAALLKGGVGIAIAILTGSVAALAVSTIAYHFIVEVLLLSVAKKERNSVEKTATDSVIRSSARVSWAINAMLLSLPLQIPFLVAQFVASAEQVGILYIAFQVSLGISGMVAVPLNRVALSTLASVKDHLRARLAVDLGGVFVAGTTLLCAVISITGILLQDVLPDQWQTAVLPSVMLLASLPVRILTPIVDGLQQAQGKWWQGSTYSGIDLLGTGLATLVAATGDLVLTALALSVWKILLGLTRSSLLLRNAGGVRLAALQTVTVIGGVLLILSPSGVAWSVATVVFGAVAFGTSLRLVSKDG